jgi:dUTP pyrophosphatase
MFKTINDGRKPERSTRYSAGFDVFANEDIVVGAGETRAIKLGIALDMSNVDNERGIFCTYGDGLEMDQYYLELHIRSSLRMKGLTSLGTGIIDIDYPDEIKMIIHNPIISVPFESLPSGYTIGYPQYAIKKGDKIGQLILKRHEGYLLPAEYTKDEARTGGFGSTGE